MEEKLRKFLADRYGFTTDEQLEAILDNSIDISIFAGRIKKERFIA